MAVPTLLQLQNAERDLQTLEAVSNDLGTTTTREGATVKTVRQVIADAQDSLSGTIAEAQAWATRDASIGPVDYQLFSALAYAQNDLTSGGADGGGSAKDWAQADEYTDIDGLGGKSAYAWALESKYWYQQFGSQYLGAQASDPSVDQNGNAVTAGDWYFNTVSNKARIYDGSSWSDVVSGITAGQNADITGIWVGGQADDYTELKARSISSVTDGDIVSVSDALRGGVFVWQSGDQSSNITNDPAEGIYVAPDSDATGASGAWKRLVLGGVVSPQMYGAAGDGDGAGGGTDDTTPLTRCLAHAALQKYAVNLRNSTFRVTSDIDVPSNVHIFAGIPTLGRIDMSTAGDFPGWNMKNVSNIKMERVGVIASASFSGNFGYLACGFLIRDGSTDISLEDCFVEGPVQRQFHILNSARIDLIRPHGFGMLNSGVRITSDHDANDYTEISDEDNPIPCRSIRIVQPKFRGGNSWSSTTQVAFYGILMQTLDNVSDEVSDVLVTEHDIKYFTTMGVGVAGENTFNVRVTDGATKSIDDNNASISSRAGYAHYVQRVDTDSSGDAQPAVSVLIQGNTDDGSVVSYYVNGDATTQSRDIAIGPNISRNPLKGGLVMYNTKKFSIVGGSYTGAQTDTSTGGPDSGRGIFLSNCDDGTIAGPVVTDNADEGFEANSTCSNLTIWPIASSGNGTDDIVIAGSGHSYMNADGGLQISDGMLTVDQTNATVGINTASPASFVTVDIADATAAAAARILGTAQQARVIIQSTNGSSTEVWFGDGAAADIGKVIYTHSTDTMGFRTAGATRATLDSAGNFDVTGSYELDGGTVIDASGGIRNQTDTAANIADQAATVNTTDKAAGKQVWDTTNNRIMVASGSGATDAWYVADGSASVTPA